MKNIPIWVTNKPWVNFFCETLLKNTHTCIPNSLQKAGKLRPTQSKFKIPQCDAAPTSVSPTHWTHNFPFDQNQSSWDQYSSPNCSWLIYQFKHKNTYSNYQIKSNPAVSIFHGHSGSVAEASTHPAGTGHTLIFKPRSTQLTPVTSQAFKTVTAFLLPGHDWGRYPYKAANGKLPTGIPNGTLGTHTLLAPLKLGEMVRAQQFPPWYCCKCQHSF